MLGGAPDECALAHNSSVTGVTAAMVAIFVHWGWQIERSPLPSGEDGSKNSKIGDRNHGLHHH